MICAGDFAKKAYDYRSSGIPYSQLDCQAFVERVLSDCGERHDWKGSNHMWRSALSWRGTLEECKKEYGVIPAGAFLFVVKNDGGERLRGYNDNDGNAAHVGIYTGLGSGAMESTTGGVQECKNMKKWTHVGLCKYINYGMQSNCDLYNRLAAIKAQIEEAMEVVKNND